MCVGRELGMTTVSCYCVTIAGTGQTAFQEHVALDAEGFCLCLPACIRYFFLLSSYINVTTECEAE